ncbi:hypothetical protein CU669_16650 [Paramagnetospirillum kuznetsovii]|uniref:Uncharacterized protein n=1 Tax=Paramagnetospirillum kuznetsovii TaxID=2053833 RepID=A0A364NUI9_9PROT|nr:hypothetical protein [Paramagnetospirillum kuznetsovii]RAU20722.1 hypothetical protein CU669_16650 [Paramagnetospirillum kuznetsovii]
MLEEGLAAEELESRLAARVNGISGEVGPIFLRSFDSATGSGPTDNVALATAAMTYDNALAVIALRLYSVGWTVPVRQGLGKKKPEMHARFSFHSGMIGKDGL